MTTDQDDMPAAGRKGEALQGELLGLLQARDKPQSAYDLIAALGGQGRKLSPPRVYRALARLVAEHRVHRIESLNAFVACDHPEAPHASQFMICDACGEAEEISNPYIDSMLRTDAGRAGFLPRALVVEIRGHCARCVAAA